MPENDPKAKDFDWRLTSFAGARREQLRRWAELPLENVLQALEEMQDIAAGESGAAPHEADHEPTA